MLFGGSPARETVKYFKEIIQTSEPDLSFLAVICFDAQVNETVDTTKNRSTSVVYNKDTRFGSRDDQLIRSCTVDTVEHGALESDNENVGKKNKCFCKAGRNSTEIRRLYRLYLQLFCKTYMESV